MPTVTASALASTRMNLERLEKMPRTLNTMGLIRRDMYLLEALVMATIMATIMATTMEATMEAIAAIMDTEPERVSVAE